MSRRDPELAEVCRRAVRALAPAARAGARRARLLQLEHRALLLWRRLDEERFHAVGEALRLIVHNPSPDWLADRLGLVPVMVRELLRELQDYGLIELVELVELTSRRGRVIVQPTDLGREVLRIHQAGRAAA